MFTIYRRKVGNWCLGVLSIALVGFGLGVSASALTAHDTNLQRRPIEADAVWGLPHSRLGDWVTYGDQFSTFTIVAEEVQPFTAAQREQGSGLNSRVMTAHIDETGWARDGVRPIVGTFTFQAPGWILRDGREVPYTYRGAPRVEIGDRFSAVLSSRLKGGTEPITLTSLLVLGTDGRLAMASPTRSPSVAVRDMTGLTPAEASALLRATLADPVSLRFADLPSDARYRAVCIAKQVCPPNMGKP